MSRRLTKKHRKRRYRIRHFFRVSFFTVVGVFLMLGIIKFANDFIAGHRFNIMNKYSEKDFILTDVTLSNDVTVQVDLLTPNEYSRPETKIKRMKGIVIHYVANPGSSAQNNRDYFEGLAATQDRYASSHFVIGLDGEIIQCIPLNEYSYASNDRNKNTISIEVCHKDETGNFNKKTYQSVVSLTAYLCHMFRLDSQDVIRHYDVTEKLCPLYYVEHEDAWIKLKQDVQDEIETIY